MNRAPALDASPSCADRPAGPAGPTRPARRPVMRRTSIFAVLVAIAFAAGAPIAHAQPAGTFPNKPVRIVVPYPTGGASDFVARLIGERLGRSLGRTVVVETKSGAAGALGAASSRAPSPTW